MTREVVGRALLARIANRGEVAQVLGADAREPRVFILRGGARVVGCSCARRPPGGPRALHARWYGCSPPLRETRIAQDRGSILEDEFGTPHRVVGSIIDITRLIETEKRLNKTENRFKKVFESNMIGMLFSNFDGRILEANDAFLEMLGYDRNDPDAAQLNWKKITPEKYLEVSYAAAKQLQEKGFCPPFEKQYIRKDGSFVSVLMGSAVLAHDDEISSVSYIIDISKQKGEEAKRRELQKLIKRQQDEFHNIFS
ncbi:MAG: PAS domain S-box protein, partial [Burkholderiales bacterium]